MSHQNVAEYRRTSATDLPSMSAAIAAILRQPCSAQPATKFCKSSNTPRYTSSSTDAWVDSIAQHEQIWIQRRTLVHTSRSRRFQSPKPSAKSCSFSSTSSAVNFCRSTCSIVTAPVFGSTVRLMPRAFSSNGPGTAPQPQLGSLASYS